MLNRLMKAGWAAAAVLAIGWGAVAEAAPAAKASVDELTRIRETLRGRLRERAKADASAESPVDVDLQIDRGLGRRGMTLHLRRQAGQWQIRDVEGVPDSMTIRRIDTEKVSWDGKSIAGPIEIAWGDDAAEEGGEEDDEAASGPAQTFQVNLAVKPVEPRLILRFARFQGGADWVLSFRRDGDVWVFDKELEAPVQLVDWGPFERTYPVIRPDADGRFSAEIRMKFVGDLERAKNPYAEHPPLVTFAGQIIDGRIETNWTLAAPGGKHLLGSGQDMLSGGIRTAEVDGTYRSRGSKGEWMGVAKGIVMPVPADPVAALEARDAGAGEPKTDAEATVRAAHLYREICALDMALRQYPMPVMDALKRLQAPEPVWPEDAPADAMAAYVDGLLHQARKALEEKPEAPVRGLVTPDDGWFGPFFGQADLSSEGEPNRVGAVSDGSQQWRSLRGWRMTGPFPVFDQELAIQYPEVVPAPGVSFRRDRLFTTVEGEVETVKDAAAWIDAALDGATVACPGKPEASSGSLRYFAWYGTCDVESEAEQTVWLSMGLQGQGMVWLNEALVWRSGVDFESPTPAIFQVKLRKGTNRLLVRCASNNASNAHCGRVDYLNGHTPRPAGRAEFTTFAVHVCTRGAPGKAAPQSVGVPPAPDAPSTYRQRGTGIYADATPPTAWDVDKGINVAWRKPLPYGWGQMIVRDGRLYVTAEPASLLCLDAKTGDILWQKDVLPLPEPPAEGEKVRTTASATAAPVVTSDRVYAYFGCGKAACYDLSGKEIWVAPAGEEWSHPNMGSPLLADGKLILQTMVRLPYRKGSVFGVMAVDAATGKPAWTASVPPKRVTTVYDRADGVGNGLAVMRLKGGGDTRTLVITGDGVVLDAATGELLHRDVLGNEATRAAPVVDGDVVYGGAIIGEEAVRLWLDEEGRVGARTLWQNKPRWGLGQVRTVRAWGISHWMKEPVVRDGLMYVVRVDTAHVPNHYQCPWTQLEILDAATGQRLARERRVLDNATDPTVAPVVAGDYIFVADGGAPVGGFGGTTTNGQMAVVELAPRDAAGDFTMHTPTHNGAWGMATLVSRNEIGRTRSAPVFEGDRMFLRTFDDVTCFAVTTPEGRRFQELQTATTTVSELLGQRPRAESVTAMTGYDEAPDSPRVPVAKLNVGGGAHDWVWIGPFDKGQAEEPPVPVDGAPDTWPQEGMAVEAGGKPCTFERIDEKHYGPGGDVELKDVMGRTDGTAWCFTVLQCATSQQVRFMPKAGLEETYLAGRRLEPGQTLSLKVGYYPLLVHARLDKLPGFASTLKLVPSLDRPPMVFDSPEEWEARASRLADRLKHICEVLPGTAQARTARVALEALGMKAPEPATTAKPTATSGPKPAPSALKPPVAAAQSDARPAGGEGGFPVIPVAVGAGVLALIVVGVVLLKRRRPA